MVNIDARTALWLVLWSRVLTTFSGAVSALAYSVIAIHHLGGSSAGVAVATCAAVGVLLGNLLGGIADFVRPPLVIGAAGLLGCVTSGVAFLMTRSHGYDLPVWCFLTLLSGLASTAAARGENTAIVHIAPRDQLPRLFGAVSMRAQVAAAAAGTVSGALIAADRALPFALDAGAWTVSVLIAVPLVRRYPRSGSPRGSFALAELVRGFTVIARSSPLLSIVAVSALANTFLAGAGAVITIDLIDRGVDVRLVGLVEAAVNVAGLLGSIASGLIARRLRTRQLFVLVLAVLTCSMAVMAVRGDVPVVVVALSCGVFLIPSLGVSAAVGLATLTPPELQARTSGANSAVSLLLTTVSPAALGAPYVHTSRSVVLSVAAAGTLVAAVIARVAVPRQVP